MAVPKRRQSKQRKRKRRTHDGAEEKQLSKCQECGAAVSAHRVCPKCGFYRGKRIVTIKVKEKNKGDK